MTIDTTRLRELLDKATPGPILLATSNSWRRIESLGHGSVCVPCKQSDGHPDLHFRNGGAEGPDAALLVEAYNALPALLDEVERTRWQPIETAPRDGSMFLAWVSAAHYGEDDEGRPFEKDCSTVDFACWRNVEGGDGYVDCMAAPHGDGYAATHWMPLPAPPAALVECPTCGGDGKETCTNPDHGFIDAMSWHDIGRLGCPGCGHDPKHKVTNGGACEDCNGTGYVSQEPAALNPTTNEGA